MNNSVKIFVLDRNDPAKKDLKYYSENLENILYNM